MNLAILIPAALVGAALCTILAFKIGFMLFDYFEERTDRVWLGFTAYLLWMAFIIGLSLGLFLEYQA